MDEGSRLSFLGEGGITTIMALCSYFRPMTIINPLYIWRFFLMALSMVFVFCSGFRGNLIVVIVAMIIGTYFRKRSSDLVTMTVIGIPLLAMTIAMNGVLFHLPLTAQRALSFLPGNWDANAKLNADDSTEWRVFMWKTMLNEKKYLKNRWLGDGFGYSREEWVAMQRLGAAGSDQENLLIVGQVHSGPLTAIRYVGIVGFALYMLLVIMMAVENWRLIRRCYGTPFFATAVFNGMTIIFFPFSYVVMFGSYDGDFPRIVFLVGLLKLLRRGITDYEATQSNPKEAGTPANALRPELLHA